jgi:hypothetical protein
VWKIPAQSTVSGRVYPFGDSLVLTPPPRARVALLLTVVYTQQANTRVLTSARLEISVHGSRVRERGSLGRHRGEAGGECGQPRGADMGRGHWKRLYDGTAEGAGHQ